MDIIVNVYDLTCFNSILHYLTIGAYHTAVQIHDKEYSFIAHSQQTTGVFVNYHHPLPLRTQITCGKTHLTTSEIEEIVGELVIDFYGFNYDLFNKNCNHFTIELITRLNCDKKVPYYINRLAKIGKYFKCCFSKAFIKGINPQDLYKRQKHQRIDSRQIYATKKIKTQTQQILIQTTESNTSKVCEQKLLVSDVINIDRQSFEQEQIISAKQT